MRLDGLTALGSDTLYSQSSGIATLRVRHHERAKEGENTAGLSPINPLKVVKRVGGNADGKNGQMT